MSHELVDCVIILTALVIQIAGIGIVIGLDSYTDKKYKKIFLTISLLTFTLVVQNAVEYWLSEYTSYNGWRTVVAVYGYSVRPAILVLFAKVLRPDKNHLIPWILVAINAVMHTTAFYSAIVFTIDKNNSYIGGPLYFLCLAVSLVLLAYLIYQTVRKYNTSRFKEIVFHLFWIFLIIAGIVADGLFNNKDQWVDYVTICIVTLNVFSYIWMHLQFVREYENNFIAEQNIRIIRSQIQPHFIYNTLSAIRNIDGNPDETKRAIMEFANYLRGNMATLDGKELIPFKQELEFVQDYAKLQQLRFPEKLNVVYEIEDVDFAVPPLTVQNLVENSIKHGIGVRYESGTITVKTYRDKKTHVIEVVDDGVGFDTEKLKTTDRVGLRAVKNRLEFYLEAKVEIESEIGKGTRVVIRIPTLQKKAVSIDEKYMEKECSAKSERVPFGRKRGVNHENNDR